MKTNTNKFGKYVLILALICVGVMTAQAATFTVTNTADSGAGSLRDAINQANASAENDTIVFAPGANGTITLLSALPDLANNGTLTIDGNGAANTIISGNNSDNRIFTSFTNLTINRLTLRDSNRGAILHFNGTMTLNDVVLTNNNAPSNGAIATVEANVNLNRVTVTNNTGSNGTGIYVQGGNLNITDSTFSGNTSSVWGDVIRVLSTGGNVSTLTMVNSTISGNRATIQNAGITLQTGGNAANTTVANITNCTITNNSTINSGQHGAIWLQSGVGTNVLNLRNTIVSGNTAGGVPFDIEGTAETSSAFNLIGTGGGLTDGVNSNIVGVNDPQLLPLADNGGTTLTHAPRCGSPAIDGGQNSNASTTDQRGEGFARTVDLGAANAGDGTDIGAVELQSEPDCTAPVITPNVLGTLGNNGWYTSNVTLSWSVIDNESTVTNQTGCASQTVTDDTTGITFTCSATSAGGSDSQSVTIKRDATAPTLTPTVTPNPVSWRDAATAAANATDSTSGIASESCTAVDTSTVGTKSLTCTATDSAGNMNTATISYVVNNGYNFTGFFQPVANLPTVNVVNAGQAIPMKFSLSGNQGLNIFAVGYPVSTPVACDATEPGSTIDETVNAGGSSLSYNSTTDQYSYVWNTNRAWRGTCRMFVLKLADGTEHFAKFRFR